MTRTTMTHKVGMLLCIGGLAIGTVAQSAEARSKHKKKRKEAVPVASAPAEAAPIAIATPPKFEVKVEDARTQRAVDALTIAIRAVHDRSVHGGYPRYIAASSTSINYGKDLNFPAGPDDIRTCMYGTPSFGKLFLNCYRVVGKPEFLEAARDAARVLAWTQNADGGWTLDTPVVGFEKDFDEAPRPEGVSFFEDFGGTQECVSFLMDLDKELDEDWLDEAVRAGLDCIVKDQTPEGAWQARTPSKPGTKESLRYFNDGCTNNSIEVLLDAYEQYGNQEYLDSALKGGQFIFKARLKFDEAPIWAEQYLPDMTPTWGRQWESPDPSTFATKLCIQTLYKLAKTTRDQKYLPPMFQAAAWLDAHQVGENLWPRYYNPQTGRPVYYDVQSTAYSDARDIPLDKAEPGTLYRNKYRGVEIRYDGDWANLRGLLRQVETLREKGMDEAFKEPTPVDISAIDRTALSRIRNNKWGNVEPLVARAEQDNGWLVTTARGRFYTMSELNTGMRALLDFITCDPQYPLLRQMWAQQ